MDQNYFVAAVKTAQKAVEAVEFALSEAGAEGTELDLLGKRQTEENAVVKGYFTVEPDREVIQSWLAQALEIYELPAEAIESCRINAVENRDWNAEWKKHWQPTKVGRFIIAPTWSKVIADDDGENPENREIIIRIDPEMAFGTGTHETTRLCLQALQSGRERQRRAPGGSFLDVGTGTGILAIAFALESRFALPNRKQSVAACDTDAHSIKVAGKNARLNQVADEIEFFVGSIGENTPAFDLVCANLTADVIVPMLPLLLEKTTAELILSGILREQQEWVETELKRLQVSNWKVGNLGEWISIVVDRRSH